MSRSAREPSVGGLGAAHSAFSPCGHRAMWGSTNQENPCSGEDGAGSQTQLNQPSSVLYQASRGLGEPKGSFPTILIFKCPAPSTVSAARTPGCPQSQAELREVLLAVCDRPGQSDKKGKGEIKR